MLSNCLVVMPYSNNKNATQHVSFAGRPRLPILRNPIKPTEGGPFVDIPNIPLDLANEIVSRAHIDGIPTGEWLRRKLNIPSMPRLSLIPSKGVNIGNVKISTLIGGDQYFKAVKPAIKSAEESILIRMFEFQNLAVDSKHWTRNGAEKVPGSKEQQELIKMLLGKKQEKPNIKIQIILDAHKWYMDSFGRVRHYNNLDMIRFLKKHGIDVVPSARAGQQGVNLDHAKLLIIDKKKAFLGGMNWGSHSPANQDFCVSLERLEGKKNSEIDNLIDEHWNPDWAFNWQRLGETRLIPGPLNEEEQRLYSGLDQEIKQENVDYHNLLHEFYEAPEAKNRYKEGKLDLMETHPVANPKIDILGTKPKEFEKIGKEGSESIFNYAIEKVKTWKKMRGKFFFNTNKEIRKIIIQRFKAGELDAKIIFNETDFPYCQNAYDEFFEAGVPVRIAKVDKSINQRGHDKWCIGDDKDIMVGSANWSDQALTQNLGKGLRDDYKLTVKEIDERIKGFFKIVKEHEDKLHIPSLHWDGSRDSYQDLKKRAHSLKKAYTALKRDGEVTFEFMNKKYVLNTNNQFVIFDGKTYPFKKNDEEDSLTELRTIVGYYRIIEKQQRSKPMYKRGNSEIAIAFESPSLAKNVLNKQFNIYWDYSESKYENLKNKIIPIKRPEQSENSLDIKG